MRTRRFEFAITNPNPMTLICKRLNIHLTEITYNTFIINVLQYNIKRTATKKGNI